MLLLCMLTCRYSRCRHRRTRTRLLYLQVRSSHPLPAKMIADGIVVTAVHNEERLPVEIMLKVLWYASLPTIVAFKSTSRFWHSVKLDLPPTTTRLWRCWKHQCYLLQRGWRGTSPGVRGIWELDLLPLTRWIRRFEVSINHAEIAARLPVSFVRFMIELPTPVDNARPSYEYLSMKRPSLPPSPPKASVAFFNDFPINIEPMYLLNHPSWYTEDMYVRYSLMPTRYSDLKRPWFTKRDRKLFDRKYHLVRGTNPPPQSTKRLLIRRLSPTRAGDSSDTSSDDGTPEWEKNSPEGPHAFGPNLIHFVQHTLLFTEKEDEWPPPHILCVQIASLDAVRNTRRRGSQPAFLIDIEIECFKSDDMAFLDWCIPDDGVEYHLVMAVEGEMQGYVFVEAERQLLTLVGIDWGEVYERWLARCAGYISRNDDIVKIRQR